jgi:hypothetical protein
MRVRQIHLVKKWGVSRGLISQYVNRGMPLSSEGEAQAWVRRNIRSPKTDFDPGYGRRLADAAFRGGPDPAPEPEGEDDDYELFTDEERAEVLKVQMAHDQLFHADWKRFCKKEVLNEDVPDGYSEATLLGCWALAFLIAKGVSEEDARDYVTFKLAVVSAKEKWSDPWESHDPPPAKKKKARTKKPGIPAKGE